MLVNSKCDNPVPRRPVDSASHHLQQLCATACCSICRLGNDDDRIEDVDAGGPNGSGCGVGGDSDLPRPHRHCRRQQRQISAVIDGESESSCHPRRCIDICSCGNVGDPTTWAGAVRRCCDTRWLSWELCGTRCTKVFLVVVNFMFLVGGLTMVTVGLLMYAADGDSTFYWKLLDGMPMVGPLVAFDRLPLIFVGVGCFVALVSFLGCCGACEDSVCFLCIYTLLLLGVLSAQIIVSVVMAVCQDQIVHDLKAALQYQITNEYNKTALPGNMTSLETNRITAAWDIMQIEMNCCGATGPGDYQFSVWANHTRKGEGVFVPLTCCILHNDDPRHLVAFDYNQCQLDAILYDPTNAYSAVSSSLKTQGCQHSFMRWLRTRIVIVVGFVSALTIIQILHLVFACMLLTSLRRTHNDCRWYEDEYG